MSTYCNDYDINKSTIATFLFSDDDRATMNIAKVKGFEKKLCHHCERF